MDNRIINHGQETSISTPSRRLDITRNFRFTCIESEKEWTAARCQRLLRTLTSRVAILRKEICRYGKRQSSESDSRTTSSSPKLVSPNKNNSTYWFKKKKKFQRTYSRLRKAQKSCIENVQTPEFSREKRLLLPGEFTIPTPVLARVRDDQYEKQNPSNAINLGKNRDEGWNGRRRSRNCLLREHRQPHLFGSIHDLRQNMSAAQYSTYDGIYNGLEILLHTTSGLQAQTKIKGTRSLLETVLRAVPRYITNQQTLLQIHLRETGSKSTIEDRDISREIYDDLENFGSCGNGWKRLKEVVRAHGVVVVCEAIEEGLLNFGFCSALVSLCIQIGAIEEAQLMLSSLLSSTAYSPPKTPSDALCKPISLLQNFTKHTNQTSFFYRELSKLISKGTLPFEWLASKELGQAWTMLIQSLAPESLEDEASTFLNIAFSLFLKYPNQSYLCKNIRNMNLKNGYLSNEVKGAINNTFSSVLTILLSIVLLVENSEQGSDITKNPSLGRFDYIVSFLGRFLDYLPDNDLENGQYLLLLIANIIIHKEHNKMKSKLFILSNLPARLSSIRDRNTKLSQVAEFVCQVARCCGRGTSGLGFDYLKIIHLRLKALDLERDITSFLKGVVVDSASMFARKVPHYHHVEYAASMDATYFTRANSTLNDEIFPLRNTMEENVSGFRWEDGIGEWVTTTPATSKLKRKETQLSEGIGLSTISPKPSKIRRKIMDSVSVVIQSTICEENTQKMDGVSKKCSDLSNFSFEELPADRILSQSILPFKNEKKNFGRLQKQSKIKNNSIASQFLHDQNEIPNQNHVDLQNQRPREISKSSRLNDEYVEFDYNLSRHKGPLTNGSPDIHINIISSPSIDLSVDSKSNPKGRKLIPDSPSSLSFSASIESPSHHRLCDSDFIGYSDQTWKLLPFGDDEDELSQLSFTSIRNKKRIARDRKTRMRSGINHATSNEKRDVIRRERPSTNIEIRIENMNVKKCFLSKRTWSKHSGCDKEWSEDELCS